MLKMNRCRERSGDGCNVSLLIEQSRHIFALAASVRLRRSLINKSNICRRGH